MEIIAQQTRFPPSKTISSDSHGAFQEIDPPIPDQQEALRHSHRSETPELVRESNVTESFRSNAANHVCRHCRRCFISGRVLGSHTGVHSIQFTEILQKERLRGNNAYARANLESQHHSACFHCRNCKGNRSDFIEDREEEDALPMHESSSSEANNDIGQFSKTDNTIHPLYALGRNPKHGRIITAREFATDSAAGIQISAHAAKGASSSSPESTRVCSECGKEFLSWKALFGHMRCHPEREWRGIQPPEMVGPQDKAGSGLGISICKTIRGTVPEDFRHELELDLEKREIEESEGCCERTDADVIVMKQEGSICQDAEEEESNERGEAGKSSGRGEGGTIGERAGESRKGKVSDNDSDLESVQRGQPYTWSQRRSHGRMTRKRSKRPRHTPKPLQIEAYEEPPLDSVTSPTLIEEELDMTDCLIMLAYAGKSLEEAARTRRQLTEESAFCGSGRNSMTGQRSQRTDDDAEEQETKWVGKSVTGIRRCGSEKKTDEAGLCEDGGVARGLVNDARQKGAADSLTGYECSTCKRIFNSHQALGGHRASHRRAKDGFVRANVGKESLESIGQGKTSEESLNLGDGLPHSRGLHSAHGQNPEKLHSCVRWGDVQQLSSARQLKGHECSVCRRVFTSGQALGGHKRCHWSGERATEMTSVASSSKTASSILGQSGNLKGDYFDLNLPAPHDDENTEEACDLVGVAGHSRFLDARGSEETMEGYKSAGNGGEHDATLDDSRVAEEMHSGAPASLSLERRSESNVESGESQEYGTMNRVQLNFRSRFVHCNICGSVFPSLEAFSNHQKSHASSLSSVAGLTPIYT